MRPKEQPHRPEESGRQWRASWVWAAGAAVLLAIGLLVLESEKRPGLPVIPTRPTSLPLSSSSRPSSPAALPSPEPPRTYPEKPPSPACEAALQQGLAAGQRGEMAAAARAFERAVHADPRAGLARDYLGIAYLKQGRVAAARRQFQEEIRLEPQSATGWARLADVDVAQGKPQDAVKALQRAAALSPEMAQLHLNLGILYPQVMEMNKGLEELDRCIALEPQNHYAHYLRGNLLSELARVDEAEQALQEAIRLAPNVGLYHLRLAEVYLQRDGTAASAEQARAELEEALRLGLEQPGLAHYRLGICWQREGQWESARRELETAVRLAPGAVQAQYALRQVLMQMGRTDEARRVQARFLALRAKEDAQRQRAFYVQEVQRNPKSPDARYQLAQFLANAGQTAEARQALARARQLAQGHPDAPGLQQRIAALSARLQRQTQ